MPNASEAKFVAAPGSNLSTRRQKAKTVGGEDQTQEKQQNGNHECDQKRQHTESNPSMVFLKISSFKKILRPQLRWQLQRLKIQSAPTQFHQLHPHLPTTPSLAHPRYLLCSTAQQHHAHKLFAPRWEQLFHRTDDVIKWTGSTWISHVNWKFY